MSTTFTAPGRFAGKRILITGGSGGIGRATAERIVAEGGRVLVTGTNPEKLAAVKEKLPEVVTLVNDAGDPAECAKAYCQAGADELALLDITATVENRPTMLEVVKKVAEVTTIPFTVGGGIFDVASASAVLKAGANKISTSSAAFRKPEMIKEMITEFGPEKVTVAIDVDINESLPSGYEVYIDGGRTATGADAVEWAKKIDGFGVPVILPTSKAGDGAQTGFDLPVIRAMAEACSADIVASGGAGKLEHFYEAVKAGATVLLAASVFHFNIIGIPELKDYLRGRGVKLR